MRALLEDSQHRVPRVGRTSSRGNRLAKQTDLRPGTGIRNTLRNIYIRAGFKDLRVAAKSYVPALELDVELTMSKSTPGEMLQVPDGTQSLTFDSAQGYLFWHVEGKGDWTHGFLALGLPGPAWYSQVLREDSPTQDCTLVFPLSHAIVSKLEDLRSGRDATLRASVRLGGFTTTLFKQFNPPSGTKGDTPVTRTEFSQAVEQDSVNVPFYLNRVLLSDRFGTNQVIVIPKSRWAEDVLPGLFWGVSKIIELPLAGVEDSMKETDRLIEEAQKKFYDGDWTGSLTASRKAVETLHPLLKAHVNPAHTDKDKGKTAEQKADDLTERFQSLAASALGYQSAVLGMLHAGAHKPVPGSTLERPDAELGFLLALGLRRYVGTRMQAARE